MLTRTILQTRNARREAFTLIELLVVISIISLLISILLPSLSRAREQAKSVHCLARLREFGTAIATYENISQGVLPPARWYPSVADLDLGTRTTPIPPGQSIPTVQYGWMELLFTHIYGELVRVAEDFPVQRNFEGDRWQEYFICKAAGDDGVTSGHYRVYLPSWSAGTYLLGAGGRYSDLAKANPDKPSRRERIRPKMPLIGDANIDSERGDGAGNDDSSFIDAGEADYAGSNGRTNGNRFSDRHYGGTNFLFQDLHAEWNTRLRRELAVDFDLNSVEDISILP